MENRYLSALSALFSNKGNMASITEKAVINFNLKQENTINREQRLHYFAIGHAFKQIDAKAIFEYELDEELQKEKPTQFLALQKKEFTIDFNAKLSNLINNIRNINNHYIHDFAEIEVDQNKEIIPFLKESFELAVIQTYLTEEGISFEEYNKEGKDRKLVTFLCDKFHSVNDKSKDLTEEEFKNLSPPAQVDYFERKEKRDAYLTFRGNFKKLSKKEAINHLLFITVDDAFQWTLNREHEVLEIKKGKYLSFHACLFLVSMFLYKNEANKLISKITGFKRNIFSFFSKKFSSQDVDAEESHLVKFRDIIQYLNHYPTHWNKDLELDSEYPKMTDLLKNKVIEKKIINSFPECKESNINKERFILYAKYQIWGEKNLGKKIKKDYINASFTSKENSQYENIVEISPKIRNAKKTLEDLKNKKPYSYKEFKKKETDIRKLEKETKSNPIKDKLLSRINQNTLIKSYGRNQDRFMDFAMRFLAEQNYFGEEAKFQVYRFFTMEEQEEYLAELKETVTKKEYDNLKYHQGKLIYFSSFKDHLKKYPEWDMPFVTRNNAIQIQVTFNSNLKTISIQRNLMIYLLEYALFRENKTNLKKSLLETYYDKQQEDFEDGAKYLKQHSEIDIEKKRELKKLFPKRLLHHYLKADYTKAGEVNKPKENIFKVLLDKAEKEEERYNSLLKKVEKEEADYRKTNPEDKNVTLVKDFKKRNKGKRFKFQFIRKAWHLMFFKDIYLREKEGQREYEDNKVTNAEHEKGHHKKFHITREEFNNFSRWMYAFDENQNYKMYLSELFKSKNFDENETFKDLFENSNSLNDLYNKTKKEYTHWIENNKPEKENVNKYKIDRYKYIADTENKSLFYINVPHFINFLKNLNDRRRLNTEDMIIQYKALENIPYLIEEYYYKPILGIEEQKKCRCTLYNKLRTSKLEDALLYEVAMKYLKIDKNRSEEIKTNISEILNQDVKFEIKDKQNINNPYTLTVPFKKLDSFVEIQTFKKKRQKDNYLEKLYEFLIKNKNIVKLNKEITGFTSFYTEKKLSYSNLINLNNYIINTSIKFTKVVMDLEKYFIFKDKTVKNENKNYIKNTDITSLNQFSRIWKIWKDENNKLKKRKINFRNIACHFDFPEVKSLDEVLKDIETKFIKEEVSPTNPKNFKEIPLSLKRVCTTFLNTLHNDCFNQRKKDTSKKWEDAENNYFKKIGLKK